MSFSPKELRAALGDRVYKSMLVSKHLAEVVAANPIVAEDHWDLNPHLNILHLIDKVVVACKEECEDLVPTERDVMLTWLTSVVYHGKAS